MNQKVNWKGERKAMEEKKPKKQKKADAKQSAERSWKEQAGITLHVILSLALRGY